MEPQLCLKFSKEVNTSYNKYTISNGLPLAENFSIAYLLPEPEIQIPLVLFESLQLGQVSPFYNADTSGRWMGWWGAYIKPLLVINILG